MRFNYSVLSLLLVFVFTTSSHSQTFFETTFGAGGTALPTGWSASDAGQVIRIENTLPSIGYGPPGASGGNNVALYAAASSFFGQSVTLTLNNNISTVGKSNIRIGFGRLKSAAFNRSVSLSFSTDNGSSWVLLTSNISPAAAGAWSALTIDLPTTANGVANLMFRFAYTTDNNNSNADQYLKLDDFAIGQNAILPVTLSRFEVVPSEGKAIVRFETETETNSDYFSIERSANGLDFETIGRLNGAGNSTDTRRYTFVDEKPLSGRSYYRLRQIDTDGTYTISPLFVFRTQTNEFALSPTLVSDHLVLRSAAATETDGRWLVFDVSGRIMKEGLLPAEQTETTIETGDLPTGYYLLHLQSGPEASTRQFFKQ